MKIKYKSMRKSMNFDGSDTLRLFYTFAIFEKSGKNEAKREAKSHCRRRAYTAAPLWLPANWKQKGLNARYLAEASDAGT